jgi:Ca2+/Na+ antiporter
MVSELLMGVTILSLCTAIPFAIVSWMHMGMEYHKEFCAFNAWASCFFSCVSIVCLTSYIYIV